MNSANEVYQTNNIIIGFGEIFAMYTESGQLGWVLPGRVITHSKKEATHYARRLDQLIQANMKRYNRNLVW